MIISQELLLHPKRLNKFCKSDLNQKGDCVMLLFKKRLIRAGLFSALVIASMLLLQACFPYGPEDIEEFDIVGTFYDPEANFSSYKTYAMPDTVAHINADGTSTDMRGEYDALILSQVAANMSAIGYTRVDNPDQSDMIVTLAIAREGYNLNSRYDYGDQYGSGYDYGSGTYYGGGTGYDIETGTVIINMADHKKTVDSASSIWVGLINGVVEQSYTNTSRRLIELINRCYTQSPYLGTSSN